MLLRSYAVQFTSPMTCHSRFSCPTATEGSRVRERRDAYTVNILDFV